MPTRRPPRDGDRQTGQAMPLDRIHPSDLLDQPVRRDAQPARRQWRVFVATGAVLALLFVLFAAYQRFVGAQIAQFMARPRPPTPITAAAADIRIVPKFLTGIGTIQAVRQVVVAPEVGGRITKIFFEPGAMVAEGDPLVQLNDAPERGDLANYQAQARLASANLGRDKALSARDFQSHMVVDQQQSLMDQAEAQIARTEALIAQKLIRAPFAGQLGVRQVNIGGYVNPGGAIVTLTDLSTLWVNFTLPEQAASQIRIGQKAELKADAYPGRVFVAKVTAIEPQLSQQTRTILVQATLDNADHALLPGMYAEVAITLPDVRQQVTVPETAVDYSLYGDSVFVVRPGAKDPQSLEVERVFVKTGDKVDGRVSILDGLKGGEQVAASGQLRLDNGTLVTLQPGDALQARPDATRY
jgi:multidrug efflux system membrane fusion protein